MSNDDEYFTSPDAPTSGQPAAADPYAVPPLTLPSGGKVRFHPLTIATAKDVKYLLRARDAEGAGSFANELYERGMKLLIEEWEIPGKPNLRIPRYDKTATDQLSGLDLTAITRHLGPYLRKLIAEEPGDGQGEDLPASA